MSLVLLAPLVACRRVEPSAEKYATVDASVSSDRPLDAAIAAPRAAAADGSLHDRRDREHDAVLLGDAKSGKSIGHTSVVFRVDLDNGKRAVFKPESKRGNTRYRGEIAAYRLGVALGLANVPRAYPRTFEVASFTTALGATSVAGKLFAEEAIVSPTSNVVRGAIMPWIDTLEVLPLEADPLWTRFRTWLTKGQPIPEERPASDAGHALAPREIARQASTLVVFDLLTGNWDRWSGANVGLDRAHGLVVFIDNDGAFFDPPPKDGIERTRKLFARIDRFSTSLVARLRTLSDDELGRAIGEEAPGTPLVVARAMDGVFARKREALAAIDAKIAANGEGETLYFP